jgi:hypothetical protein
VKGVGGGIIFSKFFRFPFSESKTQTAVFLHFLQCVWTAIQYHPRDFEFSENLLIFLFDSLNDCRYVLVKSRNFFLISDVLIF